MNQMANKTISIPEDLYNRLKARKKPKESFPELIARIIDEQDELKKKDISWFFGIFGQDSNEWDEIEKKIYEDRLKDVDREWVKFDEWGAGE